MDTNKLIKARLHAMEIDLKQALELLLEVYSEKEFLTYLILMQEEQSSTASLQ